MRKTLKIANIEKNATVSPLMRSVCIYRCYNYNKQLPRVKGQIHTQKWDMMGSASLSPADITHMLNIPSHTALCPGTLCVFRR